MSSLMNNFPHYLGKTLNISVRAVLEVAGVAAIPYWAGKAGVVNENISYYLAIGTMACAGIRFLASFHTKKLESIILDSPKSVVGLSAQFFYSIASGKKAQLLPISTKTVVTLPSNYSFRAGSYTSLV